MQIQATMKMAEVIHMDYHLLMIISRFGIQLGFGDKSIKMVCQDYQIDVNFFLEIINSYYNKNYVIRANPHDFPVAVIINYLRKSHDYYLRSKIPYIAALLEQLSTQGQSSNSSMVLINQFFTDYRNELDRHIRREEEKVYPYIFDIEQCFISRSPCDKVIEQIKAYSIDDYKYEHENVEDKLLDLKNILIKYVPGPLDSSLNESILIELFRLETDLRDHARIEEKILVPKVRFMEKWILEHYKP
jgi:regulator of cell morphogenesis and NO signaling